MILWYGKMKIQAKIELEISPFFDRIKISPRAFLILPLIHCVPMSQDVSTNDLMQVMKEGFARTNSRMEELFVEVDGRFTELVEAINVLSDSTDERFNQVDARFDRLEGRFDHLEGRVTKIESGMVTKDYLDEKLFDLRGDAVAMIRRHEQRFHLRTI